MTKKKPTQAKLQWVDVAIYKSRVGFFYGGTATEANARMGRNDSCEDASAITFISQSGLVVWLKHKRDLGALVHELVHVVAAILVPRGLHLNDDTDEAYAYLLQHLFEEARKL